MAWTFDFSKQVPCVCIIEVCCLPDLLPAHPSHEQSPFQSCFGVQTLDQPEQTLSQAGLANMEMLIVTRAR